MATITRTSLYTLLVAAMVTSGSVAADPQGTDSGAVQLGTEAPGEGYRRLITLEGFADGSGINCVGPRYDEVLAAARNDLRRSARREGADYVHVRANGPLAGRNGNCTDNFMRLRGVAYVKDG
jgi:hypothetical protein